jgi:cysteinyl-tRNA synthetase
MSDRLRDALIAGGIVVMDTPDGSTWSLDGPDDEGPGTPP